MLDRFNQVRYDRLRPGQGQSGLLLLLITSFALSGCQTVRMLYSGATLENTQAHDFRLAEHEQVMGGLARLRVEPGDTLPDIARHFELGFDAVVHANPELDIWRPEPGRSVLLPMQFILPDAPRKGVVVNLASMRLFYFQQKSSLDTDTTDAILTYPVGIGRKGWSTPVGRAKITYKKVHPGWAVPKSIRREHARKGDPLPAIVPAGPDNPLGDYALGLSMSGYLIHGTNKPYGVGMRVSHGCMRLYPESIEYLFQQIPVGTAVRIVNQPYLIGWRDRILYLEAHTPFDSRQSRWRLKKILFDWIKREAKRTGFQVDWLRVVEILEQAQGIPLPIGIGSPVWVELRDQADVVLHPRRFAGQPDIVPVKPDDWALESPFFATRPDAERLAAVLNHQGPAIPSRVLEIEAGFGVVSGPFRNRQTATRIAERVARELDIRLQLRTPESP